MKILSLNILLVLIMACDNTQTRTPSSVSSEIPSKVVIKEKRLAALIDSNQIEGSILIMDAHRNTYYCNDSIWAKKGRLPASTFKIPNSIIALETGIVESDSTIFEWNGEKRAMTSWEQDMTFKEAFHRSCVPCYQEIARAIGVERMQSFIDKFDYGTIKVDSSNLDMFWLVGDARITQFQQIDFLKRLYYSELPTAAETEVVMKRLMVMESNKEYTISGKTGWLVDGDNDNGWFVGYLEKGENVYFFATNISPKEGFDRNKFASIRKEITMKGLQELEIIE